MAKKIFSKVAATLTAAAMVLVPTVNKYPRKKQSQLPTSIMTTGSMSTIRHRSLI